jgi:hypothetical protein
VATLPLVSWASYPGFNLSLDSSWLWTWFQEDNGLWNFQPYSFDFTVAAYSFLGEMAYVSYGTAGVFLPAYYQFNDIHTIRAYHPPSAPSKLLSQAEKVYYAADCATGAEGDLIAPASTAETPSGDPGLDDGRAATLLYGPSGPLNPRGANSQVPRTINNLAALAANQSGCNAAVKRLGR